MWERGYTPEHVRKQMFELGYLRHGGSGLQYGYDVVQEMPYRDILHWIQMLDARLTDEAKKLRAAKR